MSDKLIKNLNLTPRQIVQELDRYIVGQKDAKRAVAIALRNRWRRLMVNEDMRDEISPKNIILIGPTGVGKTEIARRIAKMTSSPFIKVEASKYTEVGYVGRDVESIIRELMDLAVAMVQAEAKEALMQKAQEAAEECLLDLLLPTVKEKKAEDLFSFYNQEQVDSMNPIETEEVKKIADGDKSATREKFRKMLQNGQLEERTVKIDVEQSSGQPMGRMFSNMGLDDMEKNISDAMGQLFPKKTHRREVKIKEAREILINEEAAKLIDMDKVTQEAKLRVEQHGIVFIDEIDKVAGRGNKSGPDVSREGVQRDLLPLVEGSSVPTKYGPVKTDHILFIASGAFHVSKPSDLIPEFQGRFPIRVELLSLKKEDFVRILTEPENALTIQYKALLATEKIEINFTPEAIEVLADLAWQVNEKQENIGARRLATIMEKLLDEVSFEAPDIAPNTIAITPEYVNQRLESLVKDTDLSQYIL